MGLEAYGLIAFNSVILAALVFADLGLSAAMMRQAAKVSEVRKLAGQLRAAEVILIASVSIVVLLLMGTAPWIAAVWLNETLSISRMTVVQCLRLIVFGLAPQVAISLYIGVLMGRRRQVEANILNAGLILVRSGFVLIPLAFKPDVLVYFVWQAAVTWGFLAAFRWAAYRSLGHEGKPASAAWSDMRELTGYSAGMFAMAMMATATVQMDRVIVSTLLPVKEFSLYSLAATMAQAATLIVVPVSSSLFPHLTENVASGEEKALRRLYLSGSYSVASIAGAIGMVIILFSEDILHLWLHGAIVPPDVATASAILAAGGIALALQLMPFNLSLAHGHSTTNLRYGMASLMVTAPLQWLLTMQFGIIGAAATWLASQFFGTVVLGSSLNRRFRITPPSRWFLLCCGLPLGISGSVFVLGYLLAKSVEGGPVASVAIAAITGAVALCACYAASGATLRLADASVKKETNEHR